MLDLAVENVFDVKGFSESGWFHEKLCGSIVVVVMGCLLAVCGQHQTRVAPLCIADTRFHHCNVAPITFQSRKMNTNAIRLNA